MDLARYNIVDGFDRIAPGYDKANDAMTLGLHRRWRQALCRCAADRLPPGGQALDAATGSGDVLIGLRRLRPDLVLYGTDPSAPMLEVAREKTTESGLLRGDCRRLAFPDACFDGVTISWGIRNVRPLDEGLAEIRRVLRPGGRLFVLESGRPESALVRAFYTAYKRILPSIGALWGGYRPAYEFYRESVDRFPAGPEFVAELTQAGYEEADYEALFGGIAYLYCARKL